MRTIRTDGKKENKDMVRTRIILLVHVNVGTNRLPVCPVYTDTAVRIAVLRRQGSVSPTNSNLAALEWTLSPLELSEM